MAGLDGKITIGIEYRPCMVKTEAEREAKALFHRWEAKRLPYHEISPSVSELFIKKFEGFTEGTFAIVEYEDGTVHEVEPQNIRFVDNAMCEYAFSERNKESEKCKGADWHCPVCGEGHMKLDEGIVLTSNPPTYRYVCDKCGHTELSRDLIGKWDNES